MSVITAHHNVDMVEDRRPVTVDSRAQLVAHWQRSH